MVLLRDMTISLLLTLKDHEKNGTSFSLFMKTYCSVL